MIIELYRDQKQWFRLPDCRWFSISIKNPGEAIVRMESASPIAVAQEPKLLRDQPERHFVAKRRSGETLVLTVGKVEPITITNITGFNCEVLVNAPANMIISRGELVQHGAA